MINKQKDKIAVYGTLRRGDGDMGKLKRTSLVSNTCYINSLIKKYSLPITKFSYSGKKNDYMRENIKLFISKPVELLLMAKTRIKAHYCISICIVVIRNVMNCWDVRFV